MEIPELNNCSLTKFEMTLNNRKVISKILEKEKAKEKYNDSISTGNESLVSYINDDGKNIKICLGNIPPNQEVELKTYYINNLICFDLSYQASFPVIFPAFIIEDPKNKEDPYYFNKYEKKIVKGKI